MRRPVARNFLGTAHNFYRQAKVGAVGGGGQHAWIAQAQPFGDILLHAWRRGSGECEYRRVTQPLAGGAEPQVGRSEIVAPLRDAVGLIHAQERRSSTLEA
jgi:hypothetical protein